MVCTFLSLISQCPVKHCFLKLFRSAPFFFTKPKWSCYSFVIQLDSFLTVHSSSWALFISCLTFENLHRIHSLGCTHEFWKTHGVVNPPGQYPVEQRHHLKNSFLQSTLSCNTNCDDYNLFSLSVVLPFGECHINEKL